MIPAPLPPREDERLALLQELQLPAAVLVPGLEAIARQAVRQTGCPIATVSIVDAHTQWVQAVHGTGRMEQPRGQSFSSYAILGAGLFEIPDVAADPRFVGHPYLQRQPQTRFFAAMPVRVDGHAIGTIAVVDHRPRRLDEAARAALADLATMAETVFDSRLRELRHHASEERVRAASRVGSDWLWESDADGVLNWISDSVQAHTGWPASAEIGVHSLALYRPPVPALRAGWDRFRAAREKREPFRDAIAERDSAHGTMLVAMSGEPVFSPDGRFRGYRGAARDVSALIAERERAERAQQRLTTAMENVHAGLMISGPDGRVLISNAAWRNSVGRHAPSPESPWEEIVRAMAARGVYPDAVGREDEFVRWRLSLASPEATLHELRFTDRDALVSDQILPDGSVIHLSLDITERKRAERELARQRAALAVSQERTAAVLRALPDLWFVFDRDDRYLACSDEHHPKLVLPFETLRGRPFADFLPPEVSARALKATQTARSRGEVQRVEYALPMPDGTTGIFEARLSPMPDGEVLCLTRDLTERMRDAERLRISEELYRSVATTISDSLLVVDNNGAIVACNPSACESLGVEAARLAGHRLSELGFRLHDEHDRPMEWDAHPVRKVLRGGPAVRDQAHQLHYPDGRVRTMLMSARALHSGPSGAPRSCLVSFRDVTEQRAATQALAAAEERWKFALEGAGDGVWDHDEDSGRTFFSPRWKQMLGHADDEIGGSLREWLDRIHPQDRPRVGEAIRRYRAGETPDYRTEHRLRHRDGHWVWVLDRGKIVERHPDGRPRRIVGTHTDITRLKQAEQALRDKQAAELAHRAKSEFLSRMSHEMRTPLNAVIGFTQLLRMQTDGGPSKVAEYTEHVLRAGEHLLALINEVLDLQRIEEGKVPLQPESIELEPFVATVLDLLQPMAQRQKIALTSQVPRGVFARADPRSLRQVLINVASNAIKYNRPGGWVCISLLHDAAPGRIALGVEDTGSGLTEAQLARLFQPFERLGHESSDIEGTGLGLVIARGLAHEMGGALTLSSVRDAGTLARIELPAMPAPEAVAAPPVAAEPPVAPAAPERAPLRLLYVEDNRINALLFEEAMRVLGTCELRVAEDGTSALDVAREWRPQVLVLDANLPDMTGFEVLRRLRAEPGFADVPAFMCSADAMPDDLQRARDAGFQGYWTKPILIDTVNADLAALRQNIPA